MKYVYYVMNHTSSDIGVELFSSKKKMNQKVQLLLKEFYDSSSPVEIIVDTDSFSVYEGDEMLICGEYGRKLIM